MPNCHRNNLSAETCPSVYYYLIPQLQDYDIKSLLAMLSAAELTQAKEYCFTRDMHRFVVQHAILRKLLSIFLSCLPHEVEIKRKATGRPYLSKRHYPSIYFNISHSNRMSVFAFSQIGHIGIDVEKKIRFPDMKDIIEHQFTTPEKLEIHSCTTTDQSDLFYTFWTRKEAALKAHGVGLFKPLEYVDVATKERCSNNWKTRIQEADSVSTYWGTDISIHSDFAVAIASAFPLVDVDVFQINDPLSCKNRFIIT